MRCDATLARGTRLGGDAALAFATTGLLLAGPAIWLPLVEVSKFHAVRASDAISGVRALWLANMHLLAIWVFFGGVLMPVLLLGALTGLLVSARSGWRPGSTERWWRGVRICVRWAMPEVQMLAILVAFARLGTMVRVEPGPGLWCYAGMTGCMLAGWHSFEGYQKPRILAGGAAREGGKA